MATVGPASREPAVLRELVEAGVNVFRLNFSHGTHEEHSAVLADIRPIAGRWAGTSPSCRTCAGRRCGSGRFPATWSSARWARSSPWSPIGRVRQPAGADLLVPRAAERPQARRGGPVRRRHRGA